jgi:hypothetical protein
MHEVAITEELIDQTHAATEYPHPHKKKKRKEKAFCGR